MIVAGGGEHLVAAPQHVLPHYLRRHVRVAGFGQVAIRCAADESAFALRVEPAQRLAVWYYRREWSALCLLAARTALLLLALPGAAPSPSALPASALIASTAAVVPVIAIAALSLLALLLALSAAATPTLIAARLLIVLLLLLLRRRAGAGVI